MEEQKDILSLEDVKILVDNFYNKVRRDVLLADVFNQIIHGKWPTHLEKMYRFWQTVLLSEHTYYGSPFAPHAKMPINGQHFEQWKKLFFETLDENFSGKKANEAKWRAEKMAEMFQMKIKYYQNNQAKSLL